MSSGGATRAPWAAAGSPIAFPAYSGSVGDDITVSAVNEIGEGPQSDPEEVVAA